MIVSVIQLYPRLATSEADVRDNLRQCESLLQQAWRMGSELVVFPELCCTGYSFLSGEQAARVCERPDGPTFRFMQSAAISLKAYIAWGYVESDGQNLYNSATIVGPNGSPVTSYRKVNLFSSDFFWARSGDKAAPIVQTELGLMSVIVCRDLRDKIPTNIPRTASSGPPMFENGRIEIVAACVNWGKGGFPANSWMDFAADNHCVVAIANRWGKEEVESFSYTQDFGQGGSAIIEPNWKVHINGLQFKHNCVVTAVVGGKL